MKRHLCLFVSTVLIASSLALPVFAADATSWATPAAPTTTTKPATSTTTKPATTAKPVVTAPVVAANANESVYTVVSGDTLAKIAAKYSGVTFQQIATRNKLASAHLIYVGQKLVIPASTTPAPAVTTPAPAPTTPAPTTPAPTTPAPAPTTPDVVTAASENADKDLIENHLGVDGGWIICPTADLTYDKEIVVEGTFHDKNNKESKVYRKLALYTQKRIGKTAGNVVLDEFTMTAPKMTVKSPSFRIQEGTFAGDIHVEANGFELASANVKGNVHFATQENFDTFVLTGNPTISGKVFVAGKEMGTTGAKTLYSPYKADGSSDETVAVSVIYKDGKATNVYMDVFGSSYKWINGTLTQGSKRAFVDRGMYGMAIKEAGTWSAQMNELQKMVVANGFDISKIALVPTADGKDANLDAVSSVTIKVKPYLDTTQSVLDKFGK